MAIEIVYNGEVIATVEDRQIITLKCSGNTMASDVDIIVEGTGTMKASGYWADPCTIVCGFRPDVVFITAYEESGLDAGDYSSDPAIVWCTDNPWRGDDGSTLLEVTDTGFIVKFNGEQVFDATDNVYHYLAVKFG